MRALTPQEIEIVTYINYEGAPATGAIAYRCVTSTYWMRSALKDLAAMGVIKRHPRSKSNCIKWMMNK